MTMQTRSMTSRAGVPHDLQAYNGYADNLLEDHVPHGECNRFIELDENSDDDDETYIDDDEDSFETATGTSLDDDFMTEEDIINDKFPQEIKTSYDSNHFCPSWVKCCDDNLQKKPRPLSKKAAQTIIADVDKLLAAQKQKTKRSSNTVAKKTNALGARQWASGGGAHLDHIPNNLSVFNAAGAIGIPSLPPLDKKRWPEHLPTFRKIFTRGQWLEYIAEICHNISYNDSNQDVLTTDEYSAARDFMHGKM